MAIVCSHRASLWGRSACELLNSRTALWNAGRNTRTPRGIVAAGGREACACNSQVPHTEITPSRTTSDHPRGGPLIISRGGGEAIKGTEIIDGLGALEDTVESRLPVDG